MEHHVCLIQYFMLIVAYDDEALIWVLSEQMKYDRQIVYRYDPFGFSMEMRNPSRFRCTLR